MVAKCVVSGLEGDWVVEFVFVGGRQITGENQRYLYQLRGEIPESSLLANNPRREYWSISITVQVVRNI
jgi:hypothetical protein